MKRVILIIADSMGAGEAPDAGNFGDKGASTFVHAGKAVKGFDPVNLASLGIMEIPGIKGEFPAYPGELIGSYGKMQEMSQGKDTITGHWEIAGIETLTPFKTYPDGFPSEFIEAFEKEIGTEVLGNYPASGTEIIEVLGPEHEKTGKPIVYTSSDSVFQIAACTDVIPLERLYEICEAARKLLVGDWACGRVIARPYVIENGKRTRTTDRKDYSVTPPEETMLDKVKNAGGRVYAIGKISDIFNGRGVTDSVHTDGNMDGMDKTIEAIKQDFGGLIFTNLVDFDSLFGHRRDPEGYGNAIMEMDGRLPEIMEAMKEEDILIVTADHGNDPCHTGYDHTREYVPVLVYGSKVKAGVDIGVRKTFADLGKTICDYLDAEECKIGESFLDDILR